MEEKKLNALNDEALNEVTGGATYRYNEETGEFDVLDKDGKKFGSYADEKTARGIAASLTCRETLRFTRS